METKVSVILNNLDEIRKSRNHTKSQMLNVIGISRSYWTKLKKEERTPSQKVINNMQRYINNEYSNDELTSESELKKINDYQRGYNQAIKDMMKELKTLKNTHIENDTRNK